MSFRCEFCKEPQPPTARPVRVVTEVRQGPNFGWQIVVEKNACDPCAERVAAPKEPDQRLTVTREVAKRLARIAWAWKNDVVYADEGKIDHAEHH